MKKIFVFSCSVFLALSVNAQEFKRQKDLRPQMVREDLYNIYQSGQINQLEIIKALELAGVRIHKIPLKKFDQTYNLLVTMDEYVDGKKVKTTNIFGGNNEYMYTDSIPTEVSIPVIDYIDQLLFLTKEDENGFQVTFSGYMGDATYKFSKKKTRDNQYYNWRAYSETAWVLNETIPLLIYASSWVESSGVERFCGVVDLSHSEEDTKELLEQSPHYFIVSYKVSK